jgi:hypothetical protein
MAARRKSKTTQRRTINLGATHVQLEGATVLFTVDEDGKLESGVQLAPEEFKDALVRVRPSAAATKEKLAGFEELLLEQGAKGVKVLPVATSNRIAWDAEAEQKAEPAEYQPPRQMVLGLVDASNSKNKPELRHLVNRLADEEGL